MALAPAWDAHTCSEASMEIGGPVSFEYTQQLRCGTSGAVNMANGTNASTPYYPYKDYEDYEDYMDLVPVDERKLRAHKHTIAIAFWASLAAFVLLLFLILLYMSLEASPPARNHARHRPTCPWGLRLDLPDPVRRHLLLRRGPRGAPPSSGKESQQLQQEGPSPSHCSPGPPCSPMETALGGDPMASADVSHSPTGHPLE